MLPTTENSHQKFFLVSKLQGLWLGVSGNFLKLSATYLHHICVWQWGLLLVLYWGLTNTVALSWEIHDIKIGKNCCSRKINILCSSSLRSKTFCSQKSMSCFHLPGALAADRGHKEALELVFSFSETGRTFFLTYRGCFCPLSLILPGPSPS